MTASQLQLGGIQGGGRARIRAAGHVTFSLDNALAVQRNLGIVASFLPDIRARAIYAMARRLPTYAKRDIVDGPSERYNINVGRVAKDMRASILPGVQGVKLRGYFRGIGLINFGATFRQKSGGGVRYSIFRGREQVLPHAFIAVMRGGNRQVVEREHQGVGSGLLGKSHGRFPLQVHYGPTVAQMIRKGQRPDRIATAAVGFVRKEMQRQLAYFNKSLEPLSPDTSLEPTP